MALLNPFPGAPVAAGAAGLTTTRGEWFPRRIRFRPGRDRQRRTTSHLGKHKLGFYKGDPPRRHTRIRTLAARVYLFSLLSRRGLGIASRTAPGAIPPRDLPFQFKTAGLFLPAAGAGARTSARLRAEARPWTAADYRSVRRSFIMETSPWVDLFRTRRWSRSHQRCQELSIGCLAHDLS